MNSTKKNSLGRRVRLAPGRRRTPGRRGVSRSSRSCPWPSGTRPRAGPPAPHRTPWRPPPTRAPAAAPNKRTPPKRPTFRASSSKSTRFGTFGFIFPERVARTRFVRRSRKEKNPRINIATFGCSSRFLLIRVRKDTPRRDVVPSTVATWCGRTSSVSPGSVSLGTSPFGRDTSPAAEDASKTCAAHFLKRSATLRDFRVAQSASFCFLEKKPARIPRRFSKARKFWFAFPAHLRRLHSGECPPHDRNGSLQTLAATRRPVPRTRTGIIDSPSATTANRHITHPALIRVS